MIQDNFLQISIKNICCGYSLELLWQGHKKCMLRVSIRIARQGNSNEYLQLMFYEETGKSIPKLSNTHL